MGISISFDLASLKKALTDVEAEEISAGGLDGADVWYEYLTQEDDRVRPSHAALHGTRWKADDPNAPTPPLDYGCRCFIRYIAAPDSNAAEVLPEAKGELSNRSDAYETYLDDNVDDWKPIAKEAKQMRPVDRLQFIVESLIDAGAGAHARDIAFMILSVL